MYSMLSVVVAVVAFSVLVSAHGAVTAYDIEGTHYEGYKGFAPDGKPTIQWQWPNYNPMFSPTDRNVMCNGGTSAQLSAPAEPGASVTAIWGQWTHSQGPCTAYLYRCDGEFSGCDGKKKQWFKIAEVGLISGTMRDGVWCGTNIMDTLKWTINLPKGLKPGNYLIRHELMALHQANNPQIYPECAQITISGSGTAYPTEEYFTSFPGYAKLSDDNISVPIDTTAKDLTTYKVPGPPVWTGATANAGTSTGETNSGTSTGGGDATCANPIAKLNQCGGQLYKGSTCCVAGSTCKVVSTYYSQCQ